MKSEQKANYNRAVIILVLGIFLALWVFINAREFVYSGVIYLIMGIIAIFLYFVWDKFGGWK